MDHSLHGVDTREGSKLQGTNNYAMWSLKIGIALQDELLWHLFEPSSLEAIGSQAIPAASEVATSSTTSPTVLGAIHIELNTPAPARLDSTLLERQTVRARRIIISTVKDSFLPYIMHLREHVQMWEKLRSLFESKSTNRR